MRAEIVEVMAQVLRVSSETITRDTSPDTVSSWDSLSHLELVAALESRFGVRFNMREIQSMDSGEAIELALSARKC